MVVISAGSTGNGLHTLLYLSMYGRTYFGNERMTFIVDGDGRVASVLRKVKPAEHDSLVLAALASS